MRWKITGQILGLLLIILPVMYASLLIFSILLFGPWRSYSGESGPLHTRTSQVTFAVEEAIQWQDGQISVAPEKLEELGAMDAWLQVLDENGTEIYQYDKPASAPTHYTPAELILNYKFSGAIKDETQGYTLFVAKADRGDRKFSYLLGIPETQVVKGTFYANPTTLPLDVFRVLGGAVVIVTLVILLLAYFYGSRLAAPLAEVIEGIQRLARGDYPHRYPETGLYASVQGSLNTLTRALQRQEIESQRLQTAREEWIANISHDVKTPLSSLRGYAELLADPDYRFSDAEVRKYAGIMQEKSAYMESLIEDLRLTYRLKNAALPLDKRPENLVAVVREAVIDLLNDPRYSDAPLTFAPDCEEIRFDCDRRLLQRAFTNLILNALVHNAPGTPVTVSVTGGETIGIAVEDRGSGIPPEEVARLFERYYRGTNTGEAHHGTGLGMAIAREIVQAHGGSLEVSSQMGMGTKIEIRFG